MKLSDEIYVRVAKEELNDEIHNIQAKMLRVSKFEFRQSLLQVYNHVFLGKLEEMYPDKIRYMRERSMQRDSASGDQVAVNRLSQIYIIIDENPEVDDVVAGIKEQSLPAIYRTFGRTPELDAMVDELEQGIADALQVYNKKIGAFEQWKSAVEYNHKIDVKVAKGELFEKHAVKRKKKVPQLS